MRAGFLVVLWSLMLSTVAGAAPAQLYGKSVVISVSETRASRPVTGGPTTSSSSSSQFSVYISEAGRPFVRSDRTLTSRRGTEQKAIDSAPGSKIGVSVSSGVEFSGNSMVLTMRMVSGARRITVTFDGGFSSCSATVLNAREGDKPMVIKNRYTGVDREVTSIQSSVTGCSIKAGNVFAGG
jgi:hypothetical protein